MNTTNKTIECPRCAGIGYIQAFSHYAAGKCFQCFGAGTVRAGAERGSQEATHEIPSFEQAREGLRAALRAARGLADIEAQRDQIWPAWRLLNSYSGFSDLAKVASHPRWATVVRDWISNGVRAAMAAA